MANRKVIEFPSPKLREKSIKVESFDDEFRQLVKDMLDTNSVKMGVGLAAPQVGTLKRVVVINCTRVELENPEPLDVLEDSQQLVLVNPRLKLSGEKHKWKEACLSIPGVSGLVERSQLVNLKFQNYNGEPREIDLDWPMSGVVQHECDHLDGILYIHRMSGISRSMLLKKFQKRQKKIKEMVAAMSSFGEDPTPPKRGSNNNTKKKKKRKKRASKKNHLKKKKR
jgi:peptide deformylase